MTMDRRRFLLSLTGLGLALSPEVRARARYPEVAVPPAGYGAEAARLTEAIQRTFWDARSRMYRAPVRSAETVDSDPAHDNGYTLWPSLLGLHALVEGEKQHRGRYRARMAEVYHGLEQYYDRERHAYDAWRHFPGDDDRYYDDNAWVVTTLVEAFQATGDARYRDRAAEVMAGFVRGGWDASGSPGGVRWGTSPTTPGTSTRAACSTAGSALAALMLADVGVDRRTGIAWARQLLDWIRQRLVDTDGLVRDGLEAPRWSVIETKWTYNTGVPIRAHVELYRLTGDPGSLEQARRMARAATDHTGRLYDSVVHDPDRRFYYDSGFFVHYLIDGLLALHRETRDAGLLREARRNADYAYRYLRDPADGLYFRNWRLWSIGPAQYEAWRSLTGQDFRLAPDESERSREKRYERLPVLERPLVKTLLANAGTARMFWLLASAR